MDIITLERLELSYIRSHNLISIHLKYNAVVMSIFLCGVRQSNNGEILLHS